MGDDPTLKDKNVVAIDPNMSDLLYCVDSDAKDQVKFRYTLNTRRKETEVKKSRNILPQRKEENKVEDKTVQQWEAGLGEHDRTTMNFEHFKTYVKKNEVNARFATFYNDDIFRMRHFGSYRRRHVTEARMLVRFEERFGKPEQTVIAMGDFEQHKHRKFFEPVKGKGFRTLFRKAGYEVYLVDECRTSCRCSASGCGGPCTTFRSCLNPRPYRRNTWPIILRHGLLKCKTCSRLWNWDTNY